VNHLGLAHYTLRFNKASGELNFNAEDPAQSSVNVSVDITSLDTPYTEPDPDFDQDLQNSQWLDSATYPTATFRSTGVERTGPNTARVAGDLTIRGVTHPATLDVTYNASHARHPAGPNWSMIGFSARTTFLRSQYGMSFGVPSAPGANDGVGDEVELVIEAEFMKDNEAQPATPAQPAN
jgi:polyisoprenoid-binding protein YceI